MKRATALCSKMVKRSAIGAAIFGCLISGVSARMDAAAGLRSTTESQTNPGQEAASAFASRLLIVFSGVRQIGVSVSGSAVISNAGLSDIHDLTFTSIGGELSPDGSLIAYDNCSSPNRGIYIAEPDGRNASRVLPLSGNQCVVVRWSPDSKKFSYVSSQDRSLHIFEIAGKREDVIPNVDSAGWHSWSPDSNEIVYERGNGKTGRLLHVTDLRGNSRQLTFAQDFRPCEFQANLIDTWAPAWSPKGDKIAFTQCGSLFLISPSGKDLRQLTSGYASQTSALPATPAYSPRWSPDGRWIIFIAQTVVRIGAGSPLKCISSDHGVVMDIGSLPYGGGPFSIAPLRR
jgi:dipeptidyl aminopeptidase/acylaminoacyl peptidase